VFPDGTEVLRHVDLRVGQGEFVALIGPSGCGKSTLLRLAAGLLKPLAGRIVSERLDVGFVFQEATLLPYRTVLGNVELFGELDRMPKSERRRLAMEVLERVGLAGFEHKYPKALSGGMKMRASLARSLVLRPSLFLFDEPFAAVDEITRQRLNDEVMDLYTRDRFAAMFVTHSLTEACYLASRVIVMTHRPARILAEVAMPFPYPRSSDLRFTPEFTERARQVSDRLAGSGA
jgi:NitT/TauT family transport system ATP-binding protein